MTLLETERFKVCYGQNLTDPFLDCINMIILGYVLFRAIAAWTVTCMARYLLSRLGEKPEANQTVR